LNGDYVVLDDIREAGIGHESNFVQTDPETGVTTSDCREMERIVK